MFGLSLQLVTMLKTYLCCENLKNLKLQEKSSIHVNALMHRISKSCRGHICRHVNYITEKYNSLVYVQSVGKKWMYTGTWKAFCS